MSAASDCRAWAVKNGIKISLKGRIPQPIMDRFLQRGNPKARPDDAPKVKKDPLTAATGKRVYQRTNCGFCSIGKPLEYHLQYCPGTIQNGSAVTPGVWTCYCSERGHPDILKV